MFEKLLFGWDDGENQGYYDKNEVLKSKKINLELALKIINPNIYSNSIQEVKGVFYKHRKAEELGILLTNYLKELGLCDEASIHIFIKENENITINAKRDYVDGLYI